MSASVLIAGFVAFFALSLPMVLKKDIVFGGVYVFLFLYTIFTQIGYAYFPALSEFLGAYFGEEVFYKYLFFVWGSFISFLIAFRFYWKSKFRERTFEIVQARGMHQFLFFLFLVGVHLSLLIWFLANNAADLDYLSASDDAAWGAERGEFFAFMAAFKLQKVVLLVLYILWRLRLGYAVGLGRIFLGSVLISEVIAFAVATSFMANRTDLVALFLGIGTFEYLVTRDAKKSIRKLLRFGVAAVIVLSVLSKIQGMRDVVSVAGTGIERIIFQDYFAPSHILIAAMAYEYVDFLEVLRSNSANALILLNYPLLQETVMEIFVPGVATRARSYAFYPFAEGFLAFGYWGALYNGIVMVLGIALWRKLASSSSYSWNVFVIALIAMQFANIAREQTAFFVKDLYVYFLPALILFYLATGLRPRLRWVSNSLSIRPNASS